MGKRHTYCEKIVSGRLLMMDCPKPSLDHSTRLSKTLVSPNHSPYGTVWVDETRPFVVSGVANTVMRVLLYYYNGTLLH